MALQLAQGHVQWWGFDISGTESHAYAAWVSQLVRRFSWKQAVGTDTSIRTDAGCQTSHKSYSKLN